MSENDTHTPKLVATIYFLGKDSGVSIFEYKNVFPEIYLSNCNGITLLHVKYISKSDGHVIREHTIAGNFTIETTLKINIKECDQKENDKE
jgi:hypothetical protein